MKPRMLCTDCGTLDQPDTLLEGSDLVEMLGWICFAVPGLLYCWWRHALRIKVCAECGSQELVREARAAAAFSPRPPTRTAPRIGNLTGPVRWPFRLRSPRARMRRGAVAVTAWAICLALWGIAPGDAGLAVTPLLAVLSTAWMGHGALEVARLNHSLHACRAWDRNGRPLRIDLV